MSYLLNQEILPLSFPSLLSFPPFLTLSLSPSLSPPQLKQAWYPSPSPSGEVAITGLSPGTHYFVCSVGNHCSSGMRVNVTVVEGEEEEGGGGEEEEEEVSPRMLVLTCLCIESLSLSLSLSLPPSSTGSH